MGRLEPWNDRTERDTPDLIAVGNDIALVYSFEGPTLSGSVRHDVFFQWWRWDGRSDCACRARRGPSKRPAWRRNPGG